MTLCQPFFKPLQSSFKNMKTVIIVSENNKGTQLLRICGVYCGACSTYRPYDDEAIFDWITKMGMPPNQAFCKGCGSDLVNEWGGKCKFGKCTKDKGVRGPDAY